MSLSTDDQAKYKSLYLQTAREYVKELHDNASVYLVNPADAQALASLHRAAHSLTSQSNMMEYHQMGSVASVLEKLFKQTIDSKTSLSKEVVQSILHTVSLMEENTQTIEKDNQEVSLDQDAAKLQTLITV